MSPSIAGTAATSISRRARQSATLVMCSTAASAELQTVRSVFMPHEYNWSTCMLLSQDSVRVPSDGSRRQQTLTAFMRPVNPGRLISICIGTKHIHRPILLCYEPLHRSLHNVRVGAGSAQADMQQPAAVPRHHSSTSRPATAREAAMDLIDLANLKVFGNRHFRPKQREIIKAALQVMFAFQPATYEHCACARLSALLSLKSAIEHRPD